MKLKENQEKKPHPGIVPEFNKDSVCMERNSSATLPSISEALLLVQYKWTRQVGCVKTTTRNSVKLKKYAFLKQNNFMRIDKLPYHSSLSYKLNFVSRRQFSINNGKYP